jgi:chromate transporter
MTFLELFLVFLKAASLSSGGLQALPILLDELTVQRGLLTSADFATAVAIGRIAPGPNGLFVLSIGYYLAGAQGSLAAALGIVAPPLLAIGLVRAHRRLAHRPWVIGMTRGIAASAVGLLCALGYSFATPLAAQPASFGIFVVALAVLLITRADALPLLVVGGLAGVAFHLLGVPLA